MNDNWKHRSENMQCDSCMWFVPKSGAALSLGRCRRHSPTLGGYPVVFTTDWCGDHKLSENYLSENYYQAPRPEVHWHPEVPIDLANHTNEVPQPKPKPKRRRRYKMSRAGRAAIRAAVKARWAKYRKEHRSK